MDSNIAIITICGLLLFAYIFDITAGKTRIPSVIMLLSLGFISKQILQFFEFPVPELSKLLPALGTLGLILIVLEGATELNISQKRNGNFLKALGMSALPMVATSIILAWILNHYFNIPWYVGILNAIPVSIISSAIAIPSASRLDKVTKSFIIYESSLSDIIGVIIFNFMLQNQEIKGNSFAFFGVELLSMIGITFLASIILAFLMKRIKHHVKFAPIIISIILIYSVSKYFHLPALILILIFGLFINNLDSFSRFSIIKKLEPEILEKEVLKLKEITAEATFLIRSLFFLTFGFLIAPQELINPQSLFLSLLTIAIILFLRKIFLFIFRLNPFPILFFAPRGLITVLLFLSIPENLRIPILNESYVTQTIIISALLLMFGTMSKQEPKTQS